MFIIQDLDACHGVDTVEVCTESATICEAVFNTGGETCDRHCQSLGLFCVAGWDDGGACASKMTDDPRRVGNGCRIPYGTQICRCSSLEGKLITSKPNQN